jgi:glycosyltransferase involved in cell wall biosynthesis
MKILILTQYFPPEMGAPPARLFELAMRLRDRGHQVTVLTAMPNRPQGRIYNGYRGRLRMTEDMDGIRVVRVWLKTTHSTASIRRMMTDFSFTLDSVLLGAWKLPRQDVLIYQSPSLLTGLAARALSLKTRAKTVMWAGDIWPGVLVEAGQLKRGMASKFFYWLEKYDYRHAALVAVTNPGAIRQVHDRYPDVPMTVWSNGVDTSFFRPELRSQAVRDSFGVGPDQFMLGYIGLHGRFQGLDAVLGAAERLRDRPEIRFVMIGEGVEKPRLVRAVQERGLTNVSFHDPRPKKEIPPILASCDASLVPLLTRMPGTMPSKVYEGLASGVPIVVSRGCEAESLVEQHDAGRAFEPMDESDLAEKISELVDLPIDQREKMRRRCVELAGRFDRDVLAERTHQTLVALKEGRELPPIQW